MARQRPFRKRRARRLFRPALCQVEEPRRLRPNRPSLAYGDSSPKTVGTSSETVGWIATTWV